MSSHTAALCAWVWSPLSAGSGVFYGSCRCVDPATGRARSKRQTVSPDGATGLFLAGGRRPPVRAQACGVMVEAGRSHAPLSQRGSIRSSAISTEEHPRFRKALLYPAELRGRKGFLAYPHGVWECCLGL